MKYWRFIAVGLAFGLLLYYYFAVYRGTKQQEQTSNQKQWETKTDEQPPVLIKITPTQLGSDQNTWKFTVAFTAHSGDLDQDPIKVISLIDDTGKIYQPSAWQGPGPGGHHSEGIIVFDSIKSTKFVELKIKDVGGIPERSFRWTLE